MAIAHGSHLEQQTGSSISAESYFGAVDLKDARIATGGTTSRRNTRTGEKTQFHEPRCQIRGQIDAFDYPGFALAKVGKFAGTEFRGPLECSYLPP